MMEKRINSPFVSPVISHVGLDFSNDLQEVYELKDHVIPGPSGEDTDFLVEKKPVMTDSYHLNKVILERAKGCDLKSIIARCERNDDFSELCSRNVVYGDAYSQPQNLSDACEEGVRTAHFLDSLTAEEKEKFIKLAKLSKSELDSYIAEASKKKEELNQEVEKGGRE